MKIAACFLACLFGCAFANLCSDTMPCDTAVTTCSNGYTLTCRATSTASTDKHCVCVQDATGTHDQCVTNDDCHSGHHQCNHGQHWVCTNSHCHCEQPHHGGGGGHNGK